VKLGLLSSGSAFCRSSASSSHSHSRSSGGYAEFLFHRFYELAQLEYGHIFNGFHDLIFVHCNILQFICLFFLLRAMAYALFFSPMAFNTYSRLRMLPDNAVTNPVMGAFMLPSTLASSTSRL